MKTLTPSQPKFACSILLAVTAGILFTLPVGSAQSAESAVAGSPHGKPLAFEVVSIRQNKSGGAQQVGPTPDGYHMTNSPLAVPVLTANIPLAGTAFFTNDQTQGLPEWALRDPYDIDAKVSQGDLTEWQKPESQASMLRAMLQAFLLDRCKLVVHRDTKEISVYALVVGKNGPKFKEAKPGDTHPAGITLPGGGGVLVPENGGESIHFYAAPMVSLAPLLSNMAGRPVQDRTGLTGKYDFALQRPAPNVPPPGGSQDGIAASDPGPSIFSVVEDLGLKLEPAKGSVETLVIDHMERPSEN
jgi:bla regulator protein blaR1